MAMMVCDPTGGGGAAVATASSRSRRADARRNFVYHVRGRLVTGWSLVQGESPNPCAPAPGADHAGPWHSTLAERLRLIIGDANRNVRSEHRGRGATVRHRRPRALLPRPALKVTHRRAMARANATCRRDCNSRSGATGFTSRQVTPAEKGLKSSKPTSPPLINECPLMSIAAICPYDRPAREAAIGSRIALTELRLAALQKRRLNRLQARLRGAPLCSCRSGRVVGGPA